MEVNGGRGKVVIAVADRNINIDSINRYATVFHPVHVNGEMEGERRRDQYGAAATDIVQKFYAYHSVVSSCLLFDAEMTR